VSKLKKKLEDRGAEVLELPLIKILPSEDKKLIAEIFAGIATYEWAVFTSANGAREFMRLFFLAFGDIRSFGPMRIACVGDGTAEVFRNYSLEVEMIPAISTAENLAKDLVATNSLDSANVLIVTGNRNREILVQMLEDIGHAIVDTLPIYETDFTDIKDAPDYKKFLKFGADGIIFTSSSTALSYVEQEEDLVFEDGAIKPIHCSFGPETSKTLRENDLEVKLECINPSIKEMISKVVAQFGV
jgi:uroporphyrinogen-III synthase